MRFDIYLLMNKFNKIVFVAFKIFLNNVKYSDCRYIRFRINYGLKFDNYKMKVYRLFKGIIWKDIVFRNSQMNGKFKRFGVII